MTNDKANSIIDIIEELNDLKNRGEILDLNIKWDEENNTLDVKAVPKHAIQFVQLDVTVSPTGVIFNNIN